MKAPVQSIYQDAQDRKARELDETLRLQREAEAKTLAADRRARVVAALEGFSRREAAASARERTISRRASRREKRTNRGGW